MSLPSGTPAMCGPSPHLRPRFTVYAVATLGVAVSIGAMGLGRSAEIRADGPSADKDSQADV